MQYPPTGKPKKSFPVQTAVFQPPSQRATKNRNNKWIAVFQLGIKCILMFSRPLNYIIIPAPDPIERGFLRVLIGPLPLFSSFT
jgi:hypothetical protein